MRVAETRAELKAAHQHGVIARHQAVALGMSERSIDRRLETRRWSTLYPGVYLIGYSMPTWRAKLMGATLWGGDGARVSHRAAAALWQLPGFAETLVEIKTRREARVRGVVVHRFGYAEVPPVEVDRIPVTSVANTIADLCAAMPVNRVRPVVVEAVRTRAVTVGELASWLEQHGGKGRQGTARMRSILAEVDAAQLITRSEFERRFARWLREERLVAEPAYVVHGPNGFRAEVGFAFPAEKVAVELDGRQWHSDGVAFENDRHRVGSLAALGWIVLRFTWRQFHKDRDWVRDTLVGTLTTRSCGV